MVDGSWLPNGSFWVFYNGLTSLPYTIVVTDTTTGVRRAYPSDGFCGGADTSAFPAKSPSPAAVIAASQARRRSRRRERSCRSWAIGSASRCPRPIPATAASPTGAAIAQGDRFGYFSLPDFTGDPNLPEVCVKMIDATSFNGNFWFFYTSLTSLSYTLTVTDSVTGAVQTYQNGADFYALCGGADTRAFPR